MNARERNETICSLISQYYLSKRQDHIWQREPSRSALINEGKLLGFLMAHDMDLEEDKEEIRVVKRETRRIIVRFCKLHDATEETNQRVH